MRLLCQVAMLKRETHFVCIVFGKRTLLHRAVCKSCVAPGRCQCPAACLRVMPSSKQTLQVAHVHLSGVRRVQDVPRVVPRVIVDLAPDALVTMLTKAPGASISLLTQLCRQQCFDGLVGEHSKPSDNSFLKAYMLL